MCKQCCSRDKRLQDRVGASYCKECRGVVSSCRAPEPRHTSGRAGILSARASLTAGRVPADAPGSRNGPDAEHAQPAKLVIDSLVRNQHDGHALARRVGVAAGTGMAGGWDALKWRAVRAAASCSTAGMHIRGESKLSGSAPRIGDALRAAEASGLVARVGLVHRGVVAGRGGGLREAGGRCCRRPASREQRAQAQGRAAAAGRPPTWGGKARDW